MRRVIFILSGIILTVLTSADHAMVNSEKKLKKGISFHQGTWKEVLQLAKEEGKPIFIDISASWCGLCKMQKTKTFPNEKVGDFYNTHFINVAVDGEKGEGIQLASKFSVKGYPTLIFSDPKGNLIAQTSGYHNPKQLLEIGKLVINR